jgi:hypothetical protein
LWKRKTISAPPVPKLVWYSVFLEVPKWYLKSLIESLYIMTRGSHRVGRDPEVDKAFDALREALDELKQMEIDEFDIPGEEIEESDSDGLVEAEASAGDETALAALENDDSYGLKQADELATLQSEGHEDHSTSKVWLASTVLRRPYSNLHRSMSVKLPSHPLGLCYFRSKRSLKATWRQKHDQHSSSCVNSILACT